MGRIDRDVLRTGAPDGTGTMRTNHADCPAGTDTRRRLYITRKDNGIIVGYCHNCGSSGVAGASSSRYKRAAADMVCDRKVQEVVMPPNLEFDPFRWPNEAARWVQKAGIDLTIVQKYALAYDLDSRRVIIPKYDVDNRLVMWQSRRIYVDGSPKYVTMTQLDASVHEPIGTRGDTVIVVEDMLSAIKLDAYVGYDAIPLFSSNVKIEKLLTPTAKYDTIVVWLDNDGTEVARHRDNIARQLRSIGKRVEVVTHLRDPKIQEVSVLINEIEDVVTKF